MIKIVLVCGCLCSSVLFSGCTQKTIYREYYPPTESTIFKRDDGISVGAIHKEISKDGIPDWSSGKSLNLSAF